MKYVDVEVVTIGGPAHLPQNNANSARLYMGKAEKKIIFSF